ncbi:MAG: AraC family transcriptional regulator [Clostridiaceae bacterium]|jgi:serine kinase of HPr protein (carbohydrate metabolism regulator)|nr:AraC family transcriptional regulator [Clostridiaceae bacterium]
MTIRDIKDKLGCRQAAGTDKMLEREITGVYCCDLLSHAMAKLDHGNLWITVHTNLNVVAVASLTDAACVIVPEGIEIEEQTIAKANEKQVAMLSSTKTAAELSYEIISLLRKAG